MNSFKKMIVVFFMFWSAVVQASPEGDGNSTSKISGQKDTITQVEVIRTKKSIAEVSHQENGKVTVTLKKESAKPDETVLWKLYDDNNFKQLQKVIEKKKIQEPTWQPSSELQHAIAVKDTDEKPLWDLYHQKKYTEVYSRIDVLIKRYPDWKPSTKLLEELQFASQEAAKVFRLNNPVDERVIWDAIKQQRYAQVKRLIDDFQIKNFG